MIEIESIKHFKEDEEDLKTQVEEFLQNTKFCKQLEKPPLSCSALITMSIIMSANNIISTKSIFNFFYTKFVHYQSNVTPTTLKQNIRECLSSTFILHECKCDDQRDVCKVCEEDLWTVNLEGAARTIRVAMMTDREYSNHLKRRRSLHEDMNLQSFKRAKTNDEVNLKTNNVTALYRCNKILQKYYKIYWEQRRKHMHKNLYSNQTQLSTRTRALCESPTPRHHLLSFNKHRRAPDNPVGQIRQTERHITCKPCSVVLMRNPDIEKQVLELIKKRPVEQENQQDPSFFGWEEPTSNTFHKSVHRLVSLLKNQTDHDSATDSNPIPETTGFAGFDMDSNNFRGWGGPVRTAPRDRLRRMIRELKKKNELSNVLGGCVQRSETIKIGRNEKNSPKKGETIENGTTDFMNVRGQIKDLLNKEDLSGEEEPLFSFPVLIVSAILNDPTKNTATKEEIFNFIEGMFPFYRRNGFGWHNTVHHILENSDRFKKAHDGSWSVDATVAKNIIVSALANVRHLASSSSEKSFI